MAVCASVGGPVAWRFVSTTSLVFQKNKRKKKNKAGKSAAKNVAKAVSREEARSSWSVLK
jgi:hypothetical protein